MQPYLLSMHALRHPSSLHRRLWLLTAALALALLACMAQTQSASAQSDCSGSISQNVDRNGDGTIGPGEVVLLDLCRQRTFDVGGETKTVRVRYTTSGGIVSDQLMAVDTDNNGTLDFSAQQIADEIALWTQNAWTIYRNYGFNDPLGRDDINVRVFDMRGGLAGWCCGSDHYEIDTPSVLPAFRFGGDRRSPESISFHEMWHASEWSPAFGCWVIEATASTMTDHVNTPLDIFTNNDYIGRVRGYMGSGTETSLLNHCYTGAMWWKYYMQETGVINDTLDQGVNSMLDFWRNSGASDFTRMDNVIRSRGTGRTLESLWIDFAVANYAKEYTGPVVTSHYRYLDEIEASAPDYPAPRLTGNFTLNTGTAVGPTPTDIASWSSQYYQFNINPAVPIINLEVRQDVNKRLGYVLLLMRNNDVVQEIRYVGRDFVQSLANASYTRAVLIVVGLTEFSNYRFAVNATTPVLNIIDPLSSRKAMAGRIDAPDKILVKVEVLSPTGAGTPIAGIDPNTFTITVGSRVVQPADRISSAYVQGQYWMIIRAPTQTTAGDKNLTVNFGSLTDTENSAVSYASRAGIANVLVIDRSGSMVFFEGGTQPFGAAKDAARLYVDSWRTGDKVGVVAFNDVADNPSPLSVRDWDLTSRTDAINAINGLAATGGTCIGCGAQKGLDELIATGTTTHTWAMIVLSDGQENVGKISDFITAYNARRNAGEKVPVVHTVALGPDADRARLEDLAAKTGGTFSFAAIPTGAVSSAALQADEISNNLGEIYRVIGEEVAGQDQVYAETTLQASLDQTSPQTHTVMIDGAASEAIFVFKTSTSFGGVLYSLVDPDGTPYPNPTLVDDRHLVWRIPAPIPGEWKLILYPHIITLANTDDPDSVHATDEYLVEAAVDSELTFDVFLGLPVEERLIGNPMPIFATLAESLPITTASVLATVYAPNGGIYGLILHDDGAHGDGAAGDGFYGGLFAQTQSWGSYDVVVTASGTTASGPFVRRYRTSFNMLETRVLDDPDINPNADPGTTPDPNGTDTDNDDIPDGWEDDHGLDPTVDDSGLDPDHDGLTNGEEYEHGTDPHHSDTDGGGENDGSEVHTLPTAKDPLHPADDLILCPYSFVAETVYHDRDEHVDANGVVLYYDVAAEHATVDIFRAENAAGPLQTIVTQTVATGLYTDTTAALNIPYYYWLTAYDGDGNASCVRGPEAVTRTSDPIEPEGVLRINDGAAATSNVNVFLNINASSDTVEMQIGDDAIFDEETGWEPYVTGKAWTLVPEGNLGTVYALFRDAAGNVSEVEFDTIILNSPVFEEQLLLPQLDKAASE